MSNTTKTFKELLQKRFPGIEYNDWFIPVSEAAEEYADQYRTEANKDNDPEEALLDKLINELPEHGIDTSKWEYKYGDCCYTAAEFIARAFNDRDDAEEVEATPLPNPTLSVWESDKDKAADDYALVAGATYDEYYEGFIAGAEWAKKYLNR